jgi:hypothetical protein
MVNIREKKSVLMILISFSFFDIVVKIGPVLKQQQQQDLLTSKFLQQQYASVPSYNTNSSR